MTSWVSALEAMCLILLLCPPISTPGKRRGEGAWSERLGERREPVPARHVDLAAAVLDRVEDSLGDEPGLDHRSAQERAREAVALREALRLDEPRQNRVHLDPAAGELRRDRARER